MSSIQEPKRSRLDRLNQYLEKYSAVLLDWELALAEAAAEIERLSPSERDSCVVEINALKKSRCEFATAKLRVDAGWAVYRSLLIDAKLNEGSDASPTVN